VKLCRKKGNSGKNRKNTCRTNIQNFKKFWLNEIDEIYIGRTPAIQGQWIFANLTTTTLAA
jgi:hypothetical protein